MSDQAIDRHALRFVYPGTVTVAGQAIACQLAIEDLRAEGWEVLPIEYPALDRAAVGVGAVWGGVRYLYQLMRAFLQVVCSVFARHPNLVISHCQTLGGLLRQGIPHLFVACCRPDARIGVVLHGGLFLHWDSASFRHRLFMRLLKASHFVTVSSQGQKEKLHGYGMPPEKVWVLNNTTELPPMTPADVQEKFSQPRKKKVIRVTFISVLIKAKGYVEFVDAMELLAREERAYDLEITICGPLAVSAFCDREQSLEDRRDWMLKKMDSISSQSGAKSVWFEGKLGDQRQEVYRQTDIFVLPSKYPLESSPLVLAEAMASGCALVVSRAGSIPEIVDPACAILLDEVSTTSIADAVRSLAQDEMMQGSLAQHGLDRFLRLYSREGHRAFWTELVRQLVDRE